MTTLIDNLNADFKRTKTNVKRNAGTLKKNLQKLIDLAHQIFVESGGTQIQKFNEVMDVVVGVACLPTNQVRFYTEDLTGYDYVTRTKGGKKYKTFAKSEDRTGNVELLSQDWWTYKRDTDDEALADVDKMLAILEKKLDKLTTDKVEKFELKAVKKRTAHINKILAKLAE